MEGYLQHTLVFCYFNWLVFHLASNFKELCYQVHSCNRQVKPVDSTEIKRYQLLKGNGLYINK